MPRNPRVPTHYSPAPFSVYDRDCLQSTILSPRNFTRSRFSKLSFLRLDVRQSCQSTAKCCSSRPRPSPTRARSHPRAGSRGRGETVPAEPSFAARRSRVERRRRPADAAWFAPQCIRRREGGGRGMFHKSSVERLWNDLWNEQRPKNFRRIPDTAGDHRHSFLLVPQIREQSPRRPRLLPYGGALCFRICGTCRFRSPRNRRRSVIRRRCWPCRDVPQDVPHLFHRRGCGSLRMAPAQAESRSRAVRQQPSRTSRSGPSSSGPAASSRRSARQPRCADAALTAAGSDLSPPAGYSAYYIVREPTCRPSRRSPSPRPRRS